MTESAPPVGIIMGSQSDWETMQHAARTLDRLGIAHETRTPSAYRWRRRGFYDYATGARSRGLKVIIAGCRPARRICRGWRRRLTPLPVLGVPVQSRALKGMDSLLSIVQMPGGVPVATFAHRPGRGDQRRALRRRDPGTRRPRDRRGALTAGAKPRPDAIAEHPV